MKIKDAKDVAYQTIYEATPDDERIPDNIEAWRRRLAEDIVLRLVAEIKGESKPDPALHIHTPSDIVCLVAHEHTGQCSKCATCGEWYE